MFAFWLPVGLLIASASPPVLLIAKKQMRITALTHRRLGMIWSITVVVLGVSIGWSSYQMQQPLRRLETIRASADILQKHIKSADAELQLMHFADPLEEIDPIAQQKYQETIRKRALSISAESKALAQDLVSARSQFDQLNEARMRRDLLIFVCGFVLTIVLILRNAVGRRLPRAAGNQINGSNVLGVPFSHPPA